MNVWAVIPTAGTGERFGGDTPKPLVMLGGIPVVVRTLMAFESAPLVRAVVLVGHKDLLSEYQRLVKKYGLSKVVSFVAGGATRTASVRNGLNAVAKDADIVLVHDGARPLVTDRMIADGVQEAQAHGAVVAAVPVKATIKSVESSSRKVVATPDRSTLWEVQTPQAFQKSVIDRAYASTDEATDDAALVEKSGGTVKVYQGDYRNIKITTPEDLVIAEALLGKEVV
jgi:2-C-methyl-D-erythritol 4-phosphate cytidylyltransferase